MSLSQSTAGFLRGQSLQRMKEELALLIGALVAVFRRPRRSLLVHPLRMGERG
jgi:hypothetical protein